MSVQVGLVGCNSTSKAVTQSASGKNLNLNGYVILGSAEAANAEIGTPEGKLIIESVTCKSRRVGIPADQKVPTTGYFKSTETESLFGTRDKIIEFDFTAGSDAEAEKALARLEALRREAAGKTGNESGEK